MNRWLPAVGAVLVAAALWLYWQGEKKMELERARAEAERVRREEVALLASKRKALAGTSAPSTMDAGAAKLHKRNARAMDPGVRWHAVESLWRGGDPDALKWATHLLLKDDDPALRQKAAALMAGSTDRRAMSALVRALDDFEPSVRTEALASLSKMGDGAVLPYLSGRLSDDSTAVRVAAIRALDQISARIAREKTEAEAERRRAAAQKAKEP